MTQQTTIYLAIPHTVTGPWLSRELDPLSTVELMKLHRIKLAHTAEIRVLQYS